MHPFLAGLRPTLHISHRGGAALAPENTLLAFERAVRAHRTDMLELDVHVTRDGELVVAHDATVNRCSNGTGEISALTLAELRALDFGFRFTRDGGASFPFRGQGVRISTFGEVLEAFPGMRLNVELKSAPAGAEQAFAAAVRAAGATSRLCCGSEHDELAERMHRALPDGCFFYPRNALAEYVLTLRGGESPPDDPRYTVLDLPLEVDGLRLVDQALLEETRRTGRWVNVWTIDDPEQMRQLVQEGVGGIMTDRPDLLRAVLDAAART